MTSGPPRNGLAVADTLPSILITILFSSFASPLIKILLSSLPLRRTPSAHDFATLTNFPPHRMGNKEGREEGKRKEKRKISSVLLFIFSLRGALPFRGGPSILQRVSQLLLTSSIISASALFSSNLTVEKSSFQT